MIIARRTLSRLAASLAAAGALAVGPALAQEAATSRADQAQTVWRLLDYVAVDYGGAVAGGEVVNPAEYAEMGEFAGQVRTRIDALPPVPAKPTLLEEAGELQAAIAARRDPAAVATLAHTLANDLLSAYPVPLAPDRAPDLARGAALYTEQCAACHGATGLADGPAAAGLDPAPVAFADVARADQRSAFGLYQVIGQGLDGTAMPSFSQLSAQDRWALALYVGRFAYSEEEARRGERLWAGDPAVRARFPNLQAVVQTSPAVLAGAVGPDKARALTAYLRRHPEAVLPAAGGSLEIARARLAGSLRAYEAGDARKAADLALSAYLDGFEPVEPALRARDAALLSRIEKSMGEVRAAITRGAPTAEVRAQIEKLDGEFTAAGRALEPDRASAASTFAGAFTILLREGLEALLIVVAMIAFLRKAERPEVLPYVHGGWVAALAAGGLTWAAATYVVAISGASRELTEGIGSLIAAVVLVSVGIWMHGKAHADAWQKYIREKLTHALSKRSAWFLFLLAFLVVYREVFETILFYVALWSQGGAAALLAGAATAVAVLAAIAWAMLRLSRRLPIAKFFQFSAILVAVLAVVLVGKGVSALQEAGWIDVRPLAIPRLDILGVSPTVEGVAAQVLTFVALLLGFRLTRRPARSPQTGPAA